MTQLGLITGLRSEARIAESAVRACGLSERVTVHCAGPGPERAEQFARMLCAAGAPVLISFGLAGGLSDSLAPGTLVVPECVLDEDGRRFETAADLRAVVRKNLAAANLTAVGGALISTKIVITNAAAKAALAVSSGAQAVDMESIGLARAADQTGTRFAVVRAIADPARRAIPEVALLGIAEDGRLRAGLVLAGLVREPAAISDVIRLARDNARASETLRRAARLLLPALVVSR